MIRDAFATVRDISHIRLSYAVLQAPAASVDQPINGGRLIRYRLPVAVPERRKLEPPFGQKRWMEPARWRGRLIG